MRTIKKFKTIEEQKEYLIKNKNLLDDTLISKVFYERPYVSLINPYKKFFYTTLNGDVHVYDEKTSIIDYYRLATLDDLVAKEIHYLIGIFERRIKGAFAYIVSEKMNSIGDESATSYIDVFGDIDSKKAEFNNLGFNDYDQVYDRKSKKNIKASKETQEYRKKFLNEVSNINSKKKKKNNLFKKYINESMRIPFWLVVHTLSLGDLSTLYEMMGKELKNSIVNFLNSSLGMPIRNDTIFKFEDDLRIIKELRNVINHYEPLYEFIRNTLGIKLLHALNRVEKYSKKIINESFENLLEELPSFKNSDNENIVELYRKIIKKIKKEMTIAISSDI